MKHVLITGGAGFIGSHLCEKFLAHGYAVTAVDNFITGRRCNLKEVETNENFDFVEANVSDGLPLNQMKLLEAHGLAGVLHFACPASPIDFAKIPYDILKVDSLGTMHTVDLALKYDSRYLLASTSEIYGDPLEHPQKESYFGNVNTLGPRACYDETKRFAEAYVSTATQGTGLPEGKRLNGGIVRIFNTYGPKMRPDDGRVVPELCLQALQGKPLTIHGDGSQTRSFCFVSDLVEGIFRLYESSENSPVNIGNPSERSIRDFAENVARLAEVELRLEGQPAREDDPKQRCPDITRAREILNWEPKVDLEEGLRASLDYFRAYV